MDAALGQVDVQRVVEVALDHADLDVLVADIVRRLDVEAITLEVLERIDLARIVSAALGQIDLTQLVLDIGSVLTAAGLGLAPAGLRRQMSGGLVMFFFQHLVQAGLSQATSPAPSPKP